MVEVIQEFCFLIILSFKANLDLTNNATVFHFEINNEILISWIHSIFDPNNMKAILFL